MLPDLRVRLARIRDAREVVIRTSEVVNDRLASDGGGVATDRGYFEASRALRAELVHLAEEGVVLRDPQRGLVDFAGEVDGRRVWLCWHVGEERVTHYHELDSGFAGRKPL
jgi:hypothetical protein